MLRSDERLFLGFGFPADGLYTRASRHRAESGESVQGETAGLLANHGRKYIETVDFTKPVILPWMTTTKEFAQKVFKSQPFSQFLGAELTDASADSAEISLTILEHHTQQHGFVHGGVISYLADNTLTFAGGLALGGDALTSEFKINYVRPAKGHRLVARAQAAHSGKRQAVCRCEIICMADDEEKLVALAQGTIVSV
ncbi:PaaI family thioesterase [Ottowia sp.]|uniref:PaaI family thioesterase n=1 Tax=Ottowia sp. TaxID=1898956 RepID=UPI003C724EBF